MAKKIAGVLPVIHTPFHADESIDQISLARQINWAFDQGADGLCTGMVSELLRLTSDERNELTGWLVELTSGRGVVVAGIGAESTRQAVLFGKEAERVGCDAVMAIPPISTAVPSDEVKAYFCRIADEVNLPLIVQDASSYVGTSIDFDVYISLLDRYGPDKILFKPEAAPIGPNLTGLRELTSGRARILEGSGGILLIDSFHRGIVGTIPGMDLLDGVVAVWNALQAGEIRRAYQIYFPICAIVALQLQAGLDGFLAIEKYILVKRGIFTNAHRRRPYAWEIDFETAREVDRLLDLLMDVLAAPAQDS